MIDRLRAIAAKRTAPGRWGDGIQPPHWQFLSSDPDADAAFIVTADRTYEALLAVAEAARLVSQWHDSIGSGPIEELDAELGELADLCAALDAVEEPR